MDALTTIEVQEGYKQILDIVEHRDPTLCQASTDFEHVYQQACEAQEILKKAFASEWQLDDSKGCPLHPEVISPLLCRCVCVSPPRRSTRGTHDTRHFLHLCTRRRRSHLYTTQRRALRWHGSTRWTILASRAGTAQRRRSTTTTTATQPCSRPATAAVARLHVLLHPLRDVIRPSPRPEHRTWRA